MRIGIDAREISGPSTGVGRYLAGLLREWSTDEHALRHEFVLYSHRASAQTLDRRRFATRLVPGAGGTVWEQKQLLGAIGQDHLDVFFTPGYTAPLLTRVPLVAAIHDVSFAAHPQWFTAREGLRRRLLCRRTAAAARVVITISEFSRREIVALLNVPEEKIQVIPPGIEAPTPSPMPTASSLYKVLYVGSIFNRRHVPDLITAFGQIARTHRETSLDLVGANRSHPYQDIASVIARQELNGRVRWHPYVSDTELGDLYTAACAFAFLSEYEGLGMTPLEALAAGVPSVLLDTPVARESCGHAALYVQKGDIPAIRNALTRLLFDETTREALLAAGPAVLARFDWPYAARATLAAIEGAL